MRKPQLIGASSILIGCLLCATGIFMAFAEKKEAGQTGNFSSNSSGYTVAPNSNGAIASHPSGKVIATNTGSEITGNSAYRNAVQNTGDKQAAISNRNDPPKNAKTKPPENPPYEAPYGTKWERAKNGWILSKAENYGQPDPNPAPYNQSNVPIERATPRPRKPGEIADDERRGKCKTLVPINGIMTCID